MRITQMFLNKISQRKSFTARIIHLHRRIIGNKDSKLLENWHERLQSFYLTLISDVKTFCDKAIANASEGVDKTTRELNQELRKD